MNDLHQTSRRARAGRRVRPASCALCVTPGARARPLAAGARSARSTSTASRSSTSLSKRARSPRSPPPAPSTSATRLKSQCRAASSCRSSSTSTPISTKATSGAASGTLSGTFRARLPRRSRTARLNGLPPMSPRGWSSACARPTPTARAPFARTSTASARRRKSAGPSSPKRANAGAAGSIFRRRLFSRSSLRPTLPIWRTSRRCSTSMGPVFSARPPAWSRNCVRGSASSLISPSARAGRSTSTSTKAPIPRPALSRSSPTWRSSAVSRAPSWSATVARSRCRRMTNGEGRSTPSRAPA